MTRQTNARVAGFTFLFYIALGITQMLVARGIPAAEGTAAKLSVMAQHSSAERINLVLGLIMSVNALTLGVALYGITREQDNELAMLALSCRVGEGLTVVAPMMATLGLLWLAALPSVQDPAAVQLLAEFLMKVQGWNVTIAASLFAVGSTLFCWLMLRGRMIPHGLACVGLVASLILLILLPLRLAAVLDGSITMIMWIPMGIFEVILGFWLLIKGVRSPVIAT